MGSHARIHPYLQYGHSAPTRRGALPVPSQMAHHVVRDVLRQLPQPSRVHGDIDVHHQTQYCIRPRWIARSFLAEWGEEARPAAQPTLHSARVMQAGKREASEFIYSYVPTARVPTTHGVQCTGERHGTCRTGIALAETRIRTA